MEKNENDAKYFIGFLWPFWLPLLMNGVLRLPFLS